MGMGDFVEEAGVSGGGGEEGEEGVADGRRGSD